MTLRILSTGTTQLRNADDTTTDTSCRSLVKKAYHTAATACLGFSVTCGSSLITPATPEIAERFDVSRTASILALSLFVLGLAVGPMIAAPISETYGRSVVYKVSSLAYMLFVLGAGFSNSFGSLLVCRFLAGTVGGPVLAVGAGTNADMYTAKNRAVASSLFIMMPVSSQLPGRDRAMADMATVPWALSRSCDRWVRCTIQRLALDSVVYHLHRTGRHSPSNVHVRDLQENHSGPPSETP